MTRPTSMETTLISLELSTASLNLILVFGTVVTIVVSVGMFWIGISSVVFVVLVIG